MKKIIAILAVAVVALGVATKANAIEDQWSKGTMVAGAQVGFLPGIGGSLYGDYVLVDSWWKGHFTVGGELLYRHYGKIIAGSEYTYGYNEFGFAPRATYGLNITKNFEVHAGVLAGLGLSTWKWTGEPTHSTWGFLYGGVAGVRFFFTESFGLSAEFQYSGYGPYANVGVAFKF
jgi:hypothetical protein